MSAPLRKALNILRVQSLESPEVPRQVRVHLAGQLPPFSCHSSAASLQFCPPLMGSSSMRAISSIYCLRVMLINQPMKPARTHATA